MRHQGIIVARLIPACAAKTRTGCAPARASRAHPRACGENRASCSRAWHRAGSSPRVRGKLVQAPRRLPLDRLIPARAGKTGAASSESGVSRAHPRAFGETLLVGGVHRRVPAHPRACGENPVHFLTEEGAAGSSPRVRGKRPPGAGAAGPGGLIPACAGKTTDAIARLHRARAHPRMCGENATPVRTCTTPPGSSPHVRGKHRGPGLAGGERGLIPACAGKTVPVAPAGSAAWAHPRMCGENRCY